METTIVIPLWLWALFFFGSFGSGIFSIANKNTGAVFAGLGIFLGVIGTATGFVVGETMVIEGVVTPVLYEYAPMLAIACILPLFLSLIMFIVHIIDFRK